MFTYIAEARTLSIEFLNELEIHLMDHAAAEALECSPTSAIHIYKIRYPDNGAASDAVPCTRSNPRSKACWMLQTKLWITTDRSDSLMSRESVLVEMEKGLNGGKLVTNAFHDLTYAKYLGPDPTETTALDTTSPVNGSVSAPGNNNALYYTLGSIGLLVASAVLLIALYLRRAQLRDRQTHCMEPSDDGSIEIRELLSRSRQRIKEGAAHLSQNDTRHVDFEDALHGSDDEKDTHTYTESLGTTTKGTLGTTTDSNKGIGSAGTTKRSPSAHQYYQRSRRLTTSNSSLASTRNMSPTSSVRSKNYQPVKQQYLKSSGSSTASQSSKSSQRRPLNETTGGSLIEQATERRAFKGKNSANMVATHHLGGISGGTDLV